jgi:anti-sigma factor RsiW
VSAACSGFAELRSAYVDGALDDRDRERLLGHLLDCADCRDEVADLREVRRLLSATDAPTPTSFDLSQRLVSIAGTDATAPLRVRPFRRRRRFDPGGGLPRRRQALRTRITAATITVGAAVTVVGVVGYAAAPVQTVVSIEDPAAEAQAAFSSTLGEVPLTSDSLGAMMSVDAASLVPRAPTPFAGPTMEQGEVLAADAAPRAMERAARAESRVSYTGMQSFTIVRHGTAMVADVEVQAHAGQGSRIRVIGRSGPTAMRFSPRAVSSRVDGELLNLLERNYTLTATSGAVVARRPATVIAAIRDGLVAARWWVDDATGIMLWQETYDAVGTVDLSYGFTSVAISRKAGIMDHVPGRLEVPTTTTPLTLTEAGQLATAGWVCPQDLAGLSLIRIRSDGETDPNALHLVYSDGVNTVTVFGQRGRLQSSPEGLRWDARLAAHVQHAATEVASWQSGDRVYTVVTDGSEDLLTAAVRSLPHEASRTPTTLDRVKAGWAKIAAGVKG